MVQPAALRAPCRHEQFLAPSGRQLYSSNVLGGKNIFQLRAALDTVAEPVASDAAANGNGASSKQQQQVQQHRQQQQPQELVVLPTSDESEALLRIRHSVSGARVYDA